ncbi:MAG TPA: hypothetical protein VJ850_09570 [Candidatus Limnocylindrales bacterium]|nr:hypothetical protein [Candidatus Limnocylindrales bacterium]
MDQQTRFRGRIAAVTMAALVAAAIPGAAAAAAPISFGTVSVGATKTIGTSVPLAAAVSDLPPSTVLYAGGDSFINTALALSGISVPVTAGSLIATTGDISATFHLTPHLATGTDFDVDAPTCLTGTGSCSVSVTFQPTATGTRTDTLTWTSSDVQVTGGGSFGQLVQLMSSFIADQFEAQLDTSLTGIGVPSTGGVTAKVDIAASAACVELNTSSIDFGATTLGAENIAATPTITVSNCSGTGETLYARGTDAAGPSSAWTLVDSGATCSNDLGLDTYRLGLDVGPVPAPLGLSSENKLVQSIAAGADLDQVARIWTACPGSTGAGVTMTMSIHYLVVSD